MMKINGLLLGAMVMVGSATSTLGASTIDATVNKVQTQVQTKEVFRSMPEDNILERIFTSNDNNKNEYVIASIGLTSISGTCLCAAAWYTMSG